MSCSGAGCRERRQPPAKTVGSAATGSRTVLGNRAVVRPGRSDDYRTLMDDYRRRSDYDGRLGIDDLHYQIDDTGGQIEAVAFVVVSAPGAGESGSSDEHHGGEHHNFGGLFHNQFCFPFF